MPEDTVAKALHPDRRLVTPLDLLRGSDFAAATLISGAAVSNALGVLSGGGAIRSITTSNLAKMRVVSLEMFNAEPGWLEVEFRDGIWTGGRVLGPFTLQGRSEKRLVGAELYGRYFTSSIFGVVLSGYAAQPLSNGVKINISYIEDPTDYYE